MLNIPRRYTLTKRMEESSKNNTKNNLDSITATTSTKVTTGNEIKEMHFPWKSSAVVATYCNLEASRIFFRNTFGRRRVAMNCSLTSSRSP